jgi:hypothetical protein
MRVAIKLVRMRTFLRQNLDDFDHFAAAIRQWMRRRG